MESTQSHIWHRIIYVLLIRCAATEVFFSVAELSVKIEAVKKNNCTGTNEKKVKKDILRHLLLRGTLEYIRNRKTKEKITQNHKTGKKFGQNRKPHLLSK